MRFSAARLAAFLLLALGAPLAGAEAQGARERGPTTIEAELIEGVTDIEVSARGAAELRRDDVTVFGELLRYNRELGRVEAEGGVRLQRGADRFFGSRLRYDLRTDTGEFEEPAFVLNREQTLRGAAEGLEFLGRDRLRLTRGAYSSCEPGREDWRIEAREVELDYEAERARARDVRLEFLGTTLIALPYASFPLEKRRKSGFLTPYYAQSTRRGLEAGVPYYWNIAPEYDLTVTPVYMSRRGEQLQSHFRYLGASYLGELRHEYLFEDRELRRPRTGLSLLHEQRFANGLARLDVNKVSDDRYFADLRSHVRNISLTNLQREGVVSYGAAAGGAALGMQLRVQRFQTLQDPLAPIERPYDRLPQVLFAASRSDLGGLVDLAVAGEYVRFSHRTLVEGSRFTLNPTLAAPLLAPGYFLTPKLGLRTVSYRLTRTAPGQPESPSVSIPWLSLDGGLVFERELRFRGQTLTQTFEPRLFYVYVPYRAQDQLPRFDTALADFNYASLFSENRFSGGDRFGDASQVTLAASSRLLDARGGELVRATIGQRWYLRNERVGLTADAPLRSVDSSDLIASVGGRLPQGDWTFDGTLQYSTRESRAERYGVSLRYSPEIAKVINTTYRFNRDLLRQVDVSGQWPLVPGWYAIGRYNYSFRDRRLLEGLGGIEYNAGCWVFRLVLSRVQAAVQITNTTLLVQLELNGLGQIGFGDAVTFLKRQVPGYAVTNPADPALVPPGARPRLPFEQVY